MGALNCCGKKKEEPKFEMPDLNTLETEKKKPVV
jgi:hypothetical protein